MEPATKVGPDDNELLYDRAICFGHYFASGDWKSLQRLPSLPAETGT